MDVKVNTQSPIPWPRSDKKRTPKVLTPGFTNREIGNKLSSKNSCGKNCESVTPRRSLSKWPLPSRSSIETFHRAYNEMTSSPTDKIVPASGKGPSSDLQLNLFGSSTPQGKDGPSKILDKRASKSIGTPSNISSSSSSYTTPSRKSISLSPIFIDSSSSSDEGLSHPPSTNRARIAIESSSDDSFGLPPPLHQRVPLTPNGAHIQKPTSAREAKTVNVSTRRKENLSGFKMKPKKSITFDDSSSEEEQELPTTPNRNSKSVPRNLKQTSRSVPRLPTKSNPTGKENVPTRRTPKKSVTFDDSSLSGDDSLKLLRKSISESQVPPSLSKPKPSVQKNLTLTKVLSDSKLPASPVLKDHAKPLNENGSCSTWLSQESLTESSSFLKSLSDTGPNDHRTTHYRKQFSKHKDDLVKQLYQLFNKTVFENKLPAEMSITWNIRLTKTAGYCYMRSHRDLSRTARIELSTKVLDSSERVRDTLLHEMCHAAAFLVYGYRDGHGPLFKHWGRKAGILFPFLPVVSRCHTYSINTKYVYRCMNCQASVGRHTKSVDISRKGCGRCGGRFELLVNGVVTDSSKKKTPEFAQFVKVNYKNIKVADQNLKHSEIMQKLGQMFNDKATV